MWLFAATSQHILGFHIKDILTRMRKAHIPMLGRRMYFCVRSPTSPVRALVLVCSSKHSPYDGQYNIKVRATMMRITFSRSRPWRLHSFTLMASTSSHVVSCEPRAGRTYMLPPTKRPSSSEVTELREVVTILTTWAMRCGSAMSGRKNGGMQLTSSVLVEVRDVMQMLSCSDTTCRAWHLHTCYAVSGESACGKGLLPECVLCQPSS